MLSFNLALNFQKCFSESIFVVILLTIALITLNLMTLHNSYNEDKCRKTYNSIIKKIGHKLNLNYSVIKDINEFGLDYNMVPNIIHYMLFGVQEVDFVHFLSLLSVLKNQRPNVVYIHCDCTQLSGPFYERVMKVANKTMTRITIRTIERPTEIFGQKLSTEWIN